MKKSWTKDIYVPLCRHQGRLVRRWWDPIRQRWEYQDDDPREVLIGTTKYVDFGRGIRKTSGLTPS